MKRKCDGCTLCCVIPAVPELKKPINTVCPFCDKGCTIYQYRPQSCRDFNCGWIRGDMPKWMKPDKAHVMIEYFPDDMPIVVAYPEAGHERTWRNAKNEKALKDAYVKKGISVISPDGFALLAEGHTKEFAIEQLKKAQKLLRA